MRAVDDGSEDWPGEWKFQSTITDLEGIEVQVTITVPRRAAWSPSGERPPVTCLGAIAQDVANKAVEDSTNARNQVPS